ncbi:MAG TPA: M48 family metallopeptidase [Steroidobacteraceae bacterium]|nr:M48 family metallopeptidase [Steroidobacteraceae bacterium]
MNYWSVSFIAALAGATAVRWWLSARQIAAVAAHRESVPSAFADRVSAADHRKAADYTIANARFARVDVIVDVLITLALTVGGGIAAIDALWRRTGWEQPWLGTAVILSVVFTTSALNLPLTVWRTFRLEARFGFNRISPRLFLIDLAKSTLLGLAIGAPVLMAVLALMERAGRLWWLWAWALWLAVTLVMTWAWPSFIAPWFNRFSPLNDEALKARVESLARRCGFTTSGVFVVDGSRRSTHGNAYFTGIGRHKRIVFYDILMQRLAPTEIEAVLAHELGHFSLNHVRQRLLVSTTVGLGGAALLGWLAAQPRFYTSLGVPTLSPHAAILLFTMVLPVVSFFATPWAARWSRRHELEADLFAARHASGTDLAAALVKLYRDNASTLTPDPLYSAFYYSHPPALTRIRRLVEAQGPAARVEM